MSEVQVQQENEPHYRIAHLIAADFKRIESVEITPGHKSLIMLHGENEQGKTSALDSLMAVLGGKSLGAEVPIRKGKKSSYSQVTLEDESGKPIYRVRRTWEEGDKTSVKVYDLRGEREATVGSPQTLLDKIINRISFDPLRFMRAKTDEKRKMLIAAAGLSEKYDDLMAQRSAAGDTRKDLKKEVDKLESEVSSHPDPSPDKELQPISEESLDEALKGIEAHNAEVAKARDAIASYQSAASEGETRRTEKLEEIDEATARANQRIEEYRLEIAAMEEAKENLAQERANAVKHSDEAKARDAKVLASLQEAAEKLGAVKDASAIRAKIEEVAAANDSHEAQQQSKLWRRRLDEAKKAHAECEKTIEEIDAEVVALIESSDLGQRVPGLKIVGEDVLHNDLPISQSSGMRMLELSALIGMSANPALRLMLIDEVDKVDDKSLARLTEMAKERGYQLFATAVRVTADIEDMLLVSVKDGKAAASGADLGGK